MKDIKTLYDIYVYVYVYILVMHVCLHMCKSVYVCHTA